MDEKIQHHRGGFEMTRVIKVIETYERRGRGTIEDPVRKVYQLWTLDGEKIFEEDDYLKESEK